MTCNPRMHSPSRPRWPRPCPRALVCPPRRYRTFDNDDRQKPAVVVCHQRRRWRSSSNAASVDSCGGNGAFATAVLHALARAPSSALALSPSLASPSRPRPPSPVSPSPLATTVETTVNPRMHTEFNSNPRMHTGICLAPYAYGDCMKIPICIRGLLTCNPRMHMGIKSNPRMHTGIKQIPVCIRGSHENPCMHTGIA